MQPQGYALITGASSGIGEEFARQLAAQGWSLILVARSQDQLEKVRGELMSAHMGIDVVAIPLDLTVPGAAADLFQRTQSAHLDVDLLINNAGFGAFAEFASLDLGRVRQMLDLNIVALVELTHLYHAADDAAPSWRHHQYCFRRRIRSASVLHCVCRDQSICEKLFRRAA